MSHSRSLAIVVYLLASAFYLYEFALQVAPSVMVNELMHDIRLDSIGIAWLAASYYYAYAPMQIPAGMLFDRFGPRRLISFAILLCVFGTGVFLKADNLWIACVGRFLVGIGSAFSFVGILVLISNWFEDKYYAFLVGIAQLLSSVGVISGQYVLAYFIGNYGWRDALAIIAVAGMVLAVITWSVVKDAPEEDAERVKHTVNLATIMRTFIEIIQRAQTWFIAAYAFFIWGPMTFFSSLWAVQYLKVLYGISTTNAIHYEACLWVGVAIGCPLMGAASNYMRRRILPMTLCGLMGLTASIVIVSSSQIPEWMMIGLLLLIGASAAGQTVSFGLVKDINSSTNLGSASGFNNMATVAGGAILQPIIGFLMHHYWQGTMSGGAPYYDLYTYQRALILLPICYSIALFLTLFCIKESYCQATG